MKLVLQILAFTATLALSIEAQGADMRTEALDYLKTLRTKNVKRLTEIDETLARTFDEAQSALLEKSVLALKTARQEHVLRQEFLDRLIFQVDTKFRGGDLRAFLENTLTEMAKVDAISTGDAGLWKFMKFASDAVRRLPEQKENILSFLEGYMNRSVSNPVRPEDFLNSRNYTNGSTSEMGRPMERDEAGAAADRRLEEIKARAIEQLVERQIAPAATVLIVKPQTAGPMEQIQAAPQTATAPVEPIEPAQQTSEADPAL
ncbi:MAG TPA: hypothetical protein PKC28_06645 [Bdellovibrionales bacterium]|nr:hypothetical protein [Bdellovibrionales bacterium]